MRKKYRLLLWAYLPEWNLLVIPPITAGLVPALGANTISYLLTPNEMNSGGIMGETLGHLAFLFVGIVIGAIILFLFCFIGVQCRFMSPTSVVTNPQTCAQTCNATTCSSYCPSCACNQTGAGSNIIPKTCSQKNGSCNSNSDCCQGLRCSDGECIPEACDNSPGCAGTNCCQNTTALGCGLSRIFAMLV